MSKGKELAELLEREDSPEAGVDPERYTLLPTASKTDLLFACTWPWGRNVQRQEAGERARFGSAFHESLEVMLHGEAANHQATATAWNIEALELQERVVDAFAVVYPWLQGENQWGIDFTTGLSTEIAVAYDYLADTARQCDPPDEHHEYLDRGPSDIPGTADVVSVVPNPPDGKGPLLLVLDHKSGWNVSADWQAHTPGESGQLRTLALALCRLYDVERAIVAYFHAPAEGHPQVFPDMLLKSDLEAHRKALRFAHVNIGSGWMRPGPWCSHCPAWIDCPTQQSALVDLKRGAGALTSERIGSMHQAMQLYDQMRDRLREEMRAWIRAHGIGVRPDGLVVDLVSRKRSNLSQASIMRTYGALKGAKLIDKLKNEGAIEEIDTLELRAVRR